MAFQCCTVALLALCGHPNYHHHAPLSIIYKNQALKTIECITHTILTSLGENRRTEPHSFRDFQAVRLSCIQNSLSTGRRGCHIVTGHLGRTVQHQAWNPVAAKITRSPGLSKCSFYFVTFSLGSKGSEILLSAHTKTVLALVTALFGSNAPLKQGGFQPSLNHGQTSFSPTSGLTILKSKSSFLPQD